MVLKVATTYIGTVKAETKSLLVAADEYTMGHLTD